MINLRKSITLFLALAALLMVSACTTERNAVDRSPEEALDKKLFEGEFFYRQTIVDLPYTADYSFIGESNDGVILKWKITKNWLIAYNIHDALEVTNTEYDPAVNETPVIAYRILEHYDILPSENPTTGEELPVMVANTDKPWNERRYFSIDQAQNGLQNFQLKYMNMTEEWGAPYTRSGVTAYWDMEFYAHDGSYIVPKQYKKMLDKDSKNKEVEWFMFYNKEYLVRVNEWGGIYTMDDVEEFTNYEPATIIYRHTFTKVNRAVVGRRTYDKETNEWSWKRGSIDNGFRPLEMRDEIFRQFGFFTNKFKGYDPILGYKEKDVHEMANYFNTAWSSDGKDWNFTCADGQGTADAYPACASKIKYQQKLVFTSSPEMPKRMRPIDCAIAKDYNHALLAARFASMNPGSDTREFETWYYNTHKETDFWTLGDNAVRSEDWYMKVTYKDGKWTAKEDVAADEKTLAQKWANNWMSMCYVEDKAGFVQNWDGSLNEDKYPNDIVVLVHNPVEGYIPTRDADNADFYANYNNSDISSEGNFAWVCVNKEEAELADSKKLHYFETCEMNSADDGYECKIYTDNSACAKDGMVKVPVSCVRTEERVCKVDGSGNPILRHKYMNGDNRVAMINWVDQPTEYGILGVSQWNVNPETGQSLGGGSNIAGSVLQWATSRAVELARMIIDENDPAAWDYEKLMNPEYQEPPQVVFDNNPAVATKKKRAQNSMFKNEDMTKLLRNVKLPATIENTSNITEEGLEGLQKAYLLSKNKFRFDFADVKDSKWANDLVPYSMKQRMFPWVTDPSSFTDEMIDVMSPLFSGIDVMTADMERYQGTIENCYLDIAFLDGALLKFLEEKVAQHPLPDNATSAQKEERNEALIKDIYNDIELLMYKGVAQHEMGHTLGLRHNFIGSSDVENYQDKYFASENYPAQQSGIKEIVKDVYLQYPGDDINAVRTRNAALSNVTNKIHEYVNGKTVKLSDGTELQSKTKANYYTYTSVMDYQSEPYIHAVGLGKYDKAALKAVYGRSVEKYKLDSDNYIVTDKTNARGVRDADYEYPVLINTPYISSKGTLVKETPKIRIKVSDGYRVFEDYERNDLGIPVADTGGNYLIKENNYLINNGDIHHYKFESDEMREDEPAANIFDTGFRATEIIRNMGDSDDKYYFLRYFWRGNPKFREYRGRTSMKMIYDTLFRKYAYVHFLLDFNYNVIQAGWFKNMPIFNTDSRCMETVVYPTGLKTTETLPNTWCTDYLKAIDGVEYWMEKAKSSDTEYTVFKSQEPMSPGDYILAGMEGINYLLFDEIYRPAVSVYAKIDDKDNDADLDSKLESGQTGYWVSGDNYIADPSLFGMKTVDIAVSDGGRYQKDHWDIQDDSDIYYEKVTRRGWAEERMVALYTLSNNGWFSSKYRRESMANGLGQMAEGIDNVIFATLSDIANESAITSFSPYCYNTNTKKVEKVNYPLTTFLRFKKMPPFVYEDSDRQTAIDNAVENHVALTDAQKTYLLSVDTHDLPKNICALATEASTDGTVYEPVHAGWTYFDKMYPMYWAMSNVMNVSADTQVLLKFVSLEIPVSERGQYADPDVDEVEYLNSSDTLYYRAKLATNYMDSGDAYDVRWWKNNKGNETEEELSYALCDKFIPSGLDNNRVQIKSEDQTVSCHYSAGWEYVGGTNTPHYDPQSGELSYYTNEGGVFTPMGTPVRKYVDEDAFRKYLSKEYARFAPAFRLVESAKTLREAESNSSVPTVETTQTSTIMETTLHQMNAYATDWFGTAVQYAWY